MTAILRLAAALLCLSVASGYASETDIAAIMDQESSNIEALPNGHVARLLTTTKPSKSPAKFWGGKVKPVQIEYSRQWIDAQPKASGNADWACLSEALYFEARGETVKGQFAVAEVILNRVESGRFPDTICGVIKQGTGKRYQCQFTYTCDGHKEVIAEPAAYARVAKVARLIMDGHQDEPLTHGATHYHTTAVKPRWSRVYKRTARIGVHVFYRDNYRTADKG